MSDVIRPEELSSAISKQLELYQEKVIEKVDKLTAKSAKELLRITQDTAPFNAKHHGKHYVSCIAVKKDSSRIGTASYTWYVKPPCYRLTHLLVNGHATQNGGRTKKDPFLKNACDKVLPEYEAGVEKIVKDG